MTKKNENLEFKLKVYFFFLPFGGEWFLTSESTGGILDELKKRGAKKQYREGVIYSFSGMAFYFALFTYFMISL